MADKPSLFTRFRNAWNIFSNKDPTPPISGMGYIYNHRPDRIQLTRNNSRTIVGPIYNRIALDVAAFDIRHVEVDENNRYKATIKDSLNYCLSEEANVDQTGRELLFDIVMSMFDEGCVAVIPTDTTIDINNTEGFDILSLRTAKILEWLPDRVRVKAYDERSGISKEIYVLKKNTAIIENPFYAIMNEPNSTAQRLLKKLSLLDVTDERVSSGRFNIVIQLPYAVKGDLKRAQAEQRRKDIEDQLTNSPYGIAYIDGTEHITELNRGVENHLNEEVDSLTSMLYSQLGMTTGILDGTADENTMNNYHTRVVVPAITAIVEEMRRKFLTKNARTRGQSIMYFSDPFKSIPTSKIGELGDKLTRNEIVSSNEIRQGMGLKPSDDPKADELINKNINHPDESNRQALDDINTKLNKE